MSQPFKEISLTGDLGDIIGSTNWAIAVRLELQSGVQTARIAGSHLRNWASQFLENQGHLSLHKADGQPFSSFEEFCNEPQPWGLGYNVEFLDPIIKARLAELAQQSDPLGVVG